MRNRNITKKQVMQNPCLTCPFEGRRPVPECLEERQLVIKDAMNLSGQHLCHTANDEKICRGGRNILLKVLFERGWITAATDEAFTRKSKEILGDNFEKTYSNRV